MRAFLHRQRRRSGEPFAIHPVAVAVILAKSQMEKATIISGLLHDTVEDTSITFAEIEDVFGPTVRKIVGVQRSGPSLAAASVSSRASHRLHHRPTTCITAQPPPSPAITTLPTTSPPALITEGETKVSKLPKMVRPQAEALDASSAKLEEQVENLRSMFIAMADDWRIVVVKLADRLHNMRTLQYMPVHKRASIARETLEIFSPLAHRLGMWQYKTELADLSFKYLFPAEHEELESTISSKFVSYEKVLDDAQQQIDELLKTDPWLQGRLRSVHVAGRTKSIYSTFKKMQRHQCGIENILDLVALRVVLCPEPIDAEVPNGAETRDGANRANGGGAVGAGAGGDWAAVHQGQEANASPDENALCYHVLGKVHSCWTPLPRTLKDYISSPKPNGYRSLHTTVLVGTQPLEVQIRTQAMHLVAEYGAAAHWAYKDEAASLPWLQIIRQWQVQVDSAHEFMQLVRQELLGTRVFVFTRNGRILNLARGATLDDARKHFETDLRGTVPMLNGKPAPPTQELSNGDIVSFERVGLASPFRALSQSALAEEEAKLRASGGVRELGDEELDLGIRQRAQRYLARSRATAGWSLCPDCQPLPGDQLLGSSELQYIARVGAEGAAADGVVHCTSECPTLASELEAGEKRLVDPALHQDAFLSAFDASTAAAGRAPEMGFHASLVVYCIDRRGMLMDVATVVTEEATNIINVHSEIYTPGGESAFKYSVMVQNRTQLEALMRAVAKVPDVTRVMRGR